MKTKLCLLWIGLAWLLGHSLPAAQLAIPDDGWWLWPDTQAAWKNDTLYLPDEVDLAKLPVNPPTGGWDVLDGTSGISVTLPSTVEQHYWGKFGLRPYTREEYTYGGRDPEVRNGNYEGVSWWWRDVDVPSSFAGKLVLLHVRGARQRAEIYVNRQLVGYDLIEETSFDCDITKALRPGGKNQIAIRITNPGGWMDWQDYNTITWGKYTFQRSHGFGGLDRGLTLTAHDPVYLQDTWVLNTPDPRTITAHALVRNATSSPQSVVVQFDVIDPFQSTILAMKQVSVNVPPGQTYGLDQQITCSAAKLWDLTDPRLYKLHTELVVKQGTPMSDAADRTFGFRWFEPRGIGQEAGLYLNGQRIRIYTAISWGFWGLNGLWPTPELAEKEVRNAKALNLNMLNFHRDIGKEEVLAQQDRLGLLRYMEPGGGKLALGQPLPYGAPSQKGPLDISGSGGTLETFDERYMEAKILRMVTQFRSHPSLVIYVIQNETEPDLTDPRVFHLLREMHSLDPSRVIATKSGISPDHQAWFPPYAVDPLYDDGAGYSGWHDKHTVGGPGVWEDSMYQGPGNFTHQIDDRKEIVDWGEMLGAAVADDSPLMIRQIQAHGGQSYDLRDHQEIEAAYHQFLDKWGFREAFPTDDGFFRDLGDKCYEFWGRVIEAARLSESNDILTISGWESTAIENHSGLVDNLRNFKGNPGLIRDKLSPLLAVAEPRDSVLKVGTATTLDLYLLNETARPAPGKLQVTLVDPKGAKVDLGSYPVPDYVKDQFVYPVKMDVMTPVVTNLGKYVVAIELIKPDGEPAASNSYKLQAVDTARPDLPAAQIGVIGGESAAVEKQLAAFPQLKVEAYHESGNYDLVIDAARGNGRVVQLNNGSPIRNTDDPALYNASFRGTAEHLRFHFDGLPPGPAKVSLYFCEKDAQVAGKRLFDVAINGKTVLKDFDIFAEAGGQNSALIKTFTVDAPEGVIDISAPRGSKAEAVFNAIKIEAGPRVVAVVCGGETYKDKSGQVWSPYRAAAPLPAELLARVERGMPLLVLSGEEAGADAAARQLAAASAFQYGGTIPAARASWMGGWVFVRSHPLYEGLPVNEVMKGDYQAPVQASYGLLVDGPAVEIVAAYSRDHDRKIGAVTFTTRLGQGTVVMHCLTGMHPIMEEKVLGNALAYLLPRTP